MTQDGIGITGLIFDYAIILSFSMGALVIFVYLWSKKRLDFDEGPKYQMMEDEEKNHDR